MKLVIPISEALTMLAAHIHSTEAFRVKANSGACVTEANGLYYDQETTVTGISFELD